MYRSVPVVGMMQDNITKLKTHIELDDTQRTTIHPRIYA